MQEKYKLILYIWLVGIIGCGAIFLMSEYRFSIGTEQYTFRLYIHTIYSPDTLTFLLGACVVVLYLSFLTILAIKDEKGMNGNVKVNR